MSLSNSHINLCKGRHYLSFNPREIKLPVQGHTKAQKWLSLASEQLYWFSKPLNIHARDKYILAFEGCDFICPIHLRSPNPRQPPHTVVHGKTVFQVTGPKKVGDCCRRSKTFFTGQCFSVVSTKNHFVIHT